MDNNTAFFVFCIAAVGVAAIWANWIPSFKKKPIEQGCHTCDLAGKYINKPICDSCYPGRMRKGDGTWFYPGWEQRRF